LLKEKAGKSRILTLYSKDLDRTGLFFFAEGFGGLDEKNMGLLF
jgi:hypothetical protein